MSNTHSFTRALRVVAISLASVVWVACGGGGDNGGETPTSPGGNKPVASVSISPSSGTVGLNKTLQLTAELRDASGKSLSNRAVTWSASPASVGTVSASGLITGVAPGTLTVTATSEGQSGSASFTVFNDSPVSKVTVTPDTQTLNVGKTLQLSVRTLDATGQELQGRTVSWTATPSTVGSVSASGLVTAITPGALTVTATSEGQSAISKITVVNNNPVYSLVLSPDTQTVGLHKTRQIVAVLKDSAGNTLVGRPITWTATPSTVGTVNDSGRVTTIAPGNLTITASSQGKADTARLTVINDNPVDQIQIVTPTRILIPNGTTQLSAVLKDSSGNTLGGRQLKWSASPATVGTISASGLVTAVAPGTLTVTAQSEAKSANVTISVVAGTVVGPTGGTFKLANGAVEITVPAGALNSQTILTAVPVAAPAAPLERSWQTVGTHYAIGPAGTKFSQPVTIKLPIKSSDLPSFAMTGDLNLRAAVGGSWTALTDVVIDATNMTISGKLRSLGGSSGGSILAKSKSPFGLPGNASVRTSLPVGLPMAGLDGDGDETVGVVAEDPQLTLSPSSADVNAQRRYAIFDAGLAPRGKGLPIPANASLPKYRWTTTGKNGSLTTPSGWTTESSTQYVATNAVLDQLSGPIDNVTVEILLNPEETNPSKQRILTATATVTADLELTFDILPEDTKIGPGESKKFELLIRDKKGNQLPLGPNRSVEWASSSYYGSIGSPGEKQTSVTYVAKTSFNNPPPRVDDITAKISEQRTSVVRDFKPAVLGGDGAWDEKTVVRDVQLGSSKAFVEVKIEYEVNLDTQPASIDPSGTSTLTVSLSPEYQGPGLMYKWRTQAQFGTLDVPLGQRTERTSVTYTGNGSASGTKQENIEVEVVSVVAGTEIESIGKATATITLSNVKVNFTVAVFTTPGGWLTTAQLIVPKVSGASSYRVTATTPDGPLDISFSGATTTNPRDIFKVYDAGDHFTINIAGGYNTIASAQQARVQIYWDRYGSVQYTLTTH